MHKYTHPMSRTCSYMHVSQDVIMAALALRRGVVE